MQDPEIIDFLFQRAVAAIDTGDQPTLEQLLATHPSLASQRLESPGPWLRDKVGQALDGFFRHPYLLWFVAEDPVRNGKLPANIADIARTITRSAIQKQMSPGHGSEQAAGLRPEQSTDLQHQLDYALLLTGWSWIAKQCDVQIDLIDALIDAGASPNGVPDNALVNHHFAAAEHCIRRGAPLTLASALCLEHWDAVPSLLQSSTSEKRQFSLILAALNGKAEALRRLIGYGVDLNARCPDLYPHSTALHQAVSSGSLEAVKVLIEAGADVDAKDSLWEGTPLGWAYYCKQPAIADYLTGKSAQS